MEKEMIEQQYDVSILDFQIAKNEEEKWDARKRMADLERTAGTLYGFEYVSVLENKKNKLK